MGKTAKPAPSLEVEVVPIDALTLDPRNARKHGRRNLDAIKGSLEQFGQRRPLVVRQDGQVIAGNGTLVAMLDLRWTEVAITRVPAGWTDDQVRAYALADNRTAELAEWDDVVLADMLAELDAGGWDLGSIGFDGLAEIAPGDSDDDVPGVGDAAATARLGEIWAMGEHRVACGSSTDADLVGRLFGEARAAAVVTDPPYGVDYVVNKKKLTKLKVIGGTFDHRSIANDALAGSALTDLVREALALALASSRPGAGCYVFHSDARRIEFEAAMLAAGYHVAQTLVWVKDMFVLGMMDYHSQHEPILYGWTPVATAKGSGPHNGRRHGWYGGRKRAALVADQQPDFAAMERDELVALLEALYSESTVVRHDRPRRSDEHPTMKPVGLLSRLIVNSTKKGGLVYDRSWGAVRPSSPPSARAGSATAWSLIPCTSTWPCDAGRPSRAARRRAPHERAPAKAALRICGRRGPAALPPSDLHRARAARRGLRVLRRLGAPRPPHHHRGDERHRL